MSIINSDEKSDEHFSKKFSYKHIDGIIEINTSWETYEEGETTNYRINLQNLEVEILEDGSTVFGSYNNNNNNNTLKINSLNEFYKQYIL